MSTPNTGIPYVPEGTLDPAAGLNLALNIIDALLQTRVLSMALTAPPISPTDGDLYIPASPATGDWTGLEDYLVRYVAEGDFWQDYAPGEQAHLVLNIGDGGFYKYIPGSPGSWVLAAGLSDAPSNGLRYVRRNGSWESLLGLLLVESTESPPDVSVADVSQLLIDQSWLQLSEIAAGVAMLSGRSPQAVVVTEGGTSRTAQSTQRGTYVRFTNAAAKAYTFDGNQPYVIDDEFHGRNIGAADLTLSTANGFTLNAPAGGGLIVPQGGTFTVKIVGADEGDVFGVTEA